MTKKQIEKYTDYLRSKVINNNEPAIIVSDRGVLHVNSSYVLGTSTASKQVDVAIRLKEASKRIS